MANALDLEEQEQIDAIKHFWNQWGNIITWVLIAVLAAYGGWFGWQSWQRSQANQASALYDEIGRSVQSGDLTRMERALADLKDKYGGTTYAAHGALAAASTLYSKGKVAEAKAALAWAADKPSSDALKSIARLRLASLQTEEKAYDEALKTLSGNFPAQFAPLAADRRGDVLLLQGKRDQAVVEFGKAYQGLAQDGGGGEYRRTVGIKLNSLGIDPEAAGTRGGGAAS